MNAYRQAQLQEALEAEAKIIREASSAEDLTTANFEEWGDSLFDALQESDAMAPLMRELFELITGKEVED